MFKILFCFALSAVAASASPVSSSLECDDDLLYWAREDIFQNSVSVDIENELISCGNTLPNWLNPLPCPNSCEELICKYSCAIRKYDFVDDSGSISEQEAIAFARGYVYPDYWTQDIVDTVAYYCIDKATADNAKDSYACPSTAYHFIECLLKNFDDIGNVYIDQNGYIDQYVYVDVEADYGSDVSIYIDQDANNNQNVRVGNSGAANIQINQKANVAQSATVGVAPGNNIAIGAGPNTKPATSVSGNNLNITQTALINQKENIVVDAKAGSNIVVDVVQRAQNNQNAKAKAAGKTSSIANTVVQQNGTIQQGSDALVDAPADSNVALGVNQNAQTNQNVIVVSAGNGDVAVEQKGDIAQDSNVGVKAGVNSSVAVGVMQNAQNNQAASVISSAKGSIQIGQNGGIRQVSNVGVSADAGSKVVIGVKQAGQNNQSGNAT